jgi:hypothetical protein
MTLWEISMRTGVPVETLREFNAAMGNELPGDKQIQIGAQILVPLGQGWQTRKPKSAGGVAQMVEDAKAKTNGLPPMEPPRWHDPEVPFPFEANSGDRAAALHALENDHKKIEEDVKRSGFQLMDPSTYFDTREDKAKYESRDAYQQATDRYASLLSDPRTSEQEIVAARNDLVRARSDFDWARGVVEQAATQSNYLTPFKEVAQLGQDLVHGVTGDYIDRVVGSGLPSGVVAAATLPVHVFDNVVDFGAGTFKGTVDLVDGVAGVVAHPIDTGRGVVSLVDRSAQTTSEGQAFQFFAEVAFGRFSSLDEAARAWQERQDPLKLAQAKLDLATDLGQAVFAESIRLAREGKYAEAAGVLLGQNTDLFLGAGALKSGRLGTTARLADDLIDARRVAPPATDPLRAAQHLDDLALERTLPGNQAGTLAPKSGAPPNRGVVWVEEPRTAGAAAEAYQSTAPGARGINPVSGRREVPGLRFDNPNPNGKSVVRFDGLDGDVLVDRKLSITGRSKQARDLRRMWQALRQNQGHIARIEVPTEAIKRAADRRLRRLGIEIPVVVAPKP